MTDRLVLTADVRNALITHAEAGAARSPPEEICGVLAGTREPRGSNGAVDDAADRTDYVTAVHRVPNVADRPQTRYELDPETTLDTIESIESTGDDVVGFYHSHPNGPPSPSATDRARATWTGYVYLIVSLAEEVTVDAWRWTGEAFELLSVEIASTGDE